MKLTRLPPIAAVLLTVIIVLAGSLCRAASLPQPAIPTQAIPNPNAFDDFHAAAKLLKDGEKLDGYLSNLDKLANPQQDAPVSLADQANAQRETARIVAENGPALARVEIGLTHHYVPPLVRHIDDRMPFITTYISLSRLLEWRGEAYARANRWRLAADSEVDAITLGHKIMQDGNLLASLVGTACAGDGESHLREAIGHLDKPDIEAIARRIAQIDAATPSFSDIVREEEWSGEVVRVNLFNEPNWAERLFKSSGYPPGDPGMTTLGHIMQDNSSDHLKRVMLSNYVHYMDTVVASMRRPYPIVLKTAPIQEPTTPPDPMLAVGNTLSSHTDVNKSIYFHYSFERAKLHLLEVALGLQAYFAQHGSYPRRLSDLVPSDLISVPTDPFTLGRPIKYRAQGRTYLLYSVGPDCTDNNGKPIISSQPPGSVPARSVRAADKGDFVVGLNTLPAASAQPWAGAESLSSKL